MTEGKYTCQLIFSTHFRPMFYFYTPLNTPIFRGHRNGALSENRLITFYSDKPKLKGVPEGEKGE